MRLLTVSPHCVSCTLIQARHMDLHKCMIALLVSLEGSRVRQELNLATCMQVNYNLMTVNIVMAATGLYQLYRKVNYEMQVKEPESHPTSIQGTAIA